MLCLITGSNWITRKETPLPQTTHKPADFRPGEMTPPGTSSFQSKKPRKVMRLISDELYRVQVQIFSKLTNKLELEIFILYTLLR